MNKFCVFFLHLAASYITWGWRKGWYWKINIDIKFTVNYVVPGTCTPITVEMDSNNAIEAFAVISYFVFKIHFKNGNADVWVQATELENSENLFQFDWIQVKHNDVEIGRITGPKYIVGGFHKAGNNKNLIYIQTYLTFIHNNIHIWVASFCVNTAFNYDGFWNDITPDDVCASKTTIGYAEPINLPYLNRCQRELSKETHITVRRNAVNPPVKNNTQNEKKSVTHAITYDYRAFQEMVKALDLSNKPRKRPGKKVAAIVGVIITIIALAIIGYIFYRKKYARPHE